MIAAEVADIARAIAKIAGVDNWLQFVAHAQSIYDSLRDAGWRMTFEARP